MIHTIIELSKIDNEIIEIPVGFFNESSNRDEALRKYFYFIEDTQIDVQNLSTGRWGKKGTLK